MGFLHEILAMDHSDPASCFRSMADELAERHLFESMQIDPSLDGQRFRILCSDYQGIGLWTAYLSVAFNLKDMQAFQGTTFDFFDDLIDRAVTKEKNDGPPF